jgi:hypothetical protein
MLEGVVLHDTFRRRLINVTQGKANLSIPLLVSCNKIIELLKPKIRRRCVWSRVVCDFTIWWPIAPRPMKPIVLVLSVEKAMANLAAADLRLLGPRMPRRGDAWLAVTPICRTV